MKILLITQAQGEVISEAKGVIETKGNRSCALYVLAQQKRGNQVTQLKVSDCEIIHNELYCKGVRIELTKYQGVVKRTWDGGKNSIKGLQLLKFLESRGLYADNPSSGIEITLSKIKMQRSLEVANVSTPTWYAYSNLNFNEKRFYHEMSKLKELFDNKSLRSNYPTYVVKLERGTHGNTVYMYRHKELSKMCKDIKAQLDQNKALIVQEYILPKKPSGIVVDHASSHFRIIMTVQNGRYKIMGGLRLSRSGSWVSNSHYKQGALIKEELNALMLSKELIGDLKKIGRHTGMRQFGADVILDGQGKHYILEINDGMGISGEYLEKQKIPEQYASSFDARLRALPHSSYTKTVVRAITLGCGLFAAYKIGKLILSPDSQAREQPFNLR